MKMGKSELFDVELLAELNDWGGPSEMSAFEAVMWRAEVDPRLRSTTTSVLFLDRELDRDSFLEAHHWIVNAVPRFRQRVVVPAFGIGNPTWVEDPDFNLDYHLRHVRLPAPGSERQLFDLAQTLAMTPFDKARSPWEATLVEGLKGGRAAYILKLHHATSDGLGIIQLLTRVFGKGRDDIRRPHPAKSNVIEIRPPTPSELATRQIRDSLFALPSEAAGSISTITRSLGGWVRNPGAVRKGLAYVWSAKRVLGTRPVAGSGLFRKRSLSWRFDAIEIPLIQIKVAAKAANASVNDVFLSGLIGGFRRYHEAMGVPIKQMPIGFPISLRSENDVMGGNKFAGSQYAAPVSMKDPLKRIRHIQQFIKDIRAEPALDVMIRLMPLVTRLPLATVTALTADFTVAQDAQISNIPGIPHPVYFGGAEVTHFWPFAPLPGCGMMITMISHNGRCCIGINSDRAAVTEPELLVKCFREGLQEVLAFDKPKKRVRKV